MRKILFGVAIALMWAPAAFASTPGADVKLTHDANDPGYFSSYTIATGIPYTNRTLAERSRARARGKQRAVGRDPRNPQVILGSSNVYGGVYNQTDADNNPVPAGPI